MIVDFLGMVSTVAGGFSCLSGVAINSAGDIVLADSCNNIIRKISSSGLNHVTICVVEFLSVNVSFSGVVSVIAGGGGSNSVGFVDGVSSVAKFSFPRVVTVISSGDIIVADTNNHLIRKISTTGEITGACCSFHLTSLLLWIMLQGYVQRGMNMWDRLVLWLPQVHSLMVFTLLCYFRFSTPQGIISHPAV